MEHAASEPNIERPDTATVGNEGALQSPQRPFVGDVSVPSESAHSLKALTAVRLTIDDTFPAIRYDDIPEAGAVVSSTVASGVPWETFCAVHIYLAHGQSRERKILGHYVLGNVNVPLTSVFVSTKMKTNATRNGIRNNCGP